MVRTINKLFSLESSLKLYYKVKQQMNDDVMVGVLVKGQRALLIFD